MLFLLFIIPIILAGPGNYYKTQGTNFTKMVSTWFFEDEGPQGYYYANQFDFVSGKIGYLGFQPRNNGQNRLVFSAFGSGPKSDSNHCNNGADGGSGVSCSDSYPWKSGQNNTIIIERTIAHEDGSNTWQGTFVDEVTQERLIYANYTTPESWGLLAGTGVHFDEWYKFNGDHLQQSQRGCVPKSKFIVYLPSFYKDGDSPKQSTLKLISHGNMLDGCEYKAKKSNTNVTQVGSYAVEYENGILNDVYQ